MVELKALENINLQAENQLVLEGETFKVTNERAEEIKKVAKVEVITGKPETKEEKQFSTK